MDNATIFAGMALKAWHNQVKQANQLFGALSDEALLREVAPGRNTALYLLGHLIAANDSMMALLGIGDRLYAHYDPIFLRAADKSGQAFPDAAPLRADWKASIDALHAGFDTLDGANWLGKHTAMSEEDHAKDPGRNKLSVLINRTGHLAYHLGQVALCQ